MVHVLLQVDVLKHTDNRGSFYDNSSMLAAALEALGHLRLPDLKSLQPVTKQLDRFLAREKVLPSYHAVVAQAALKAFVELALSMWPAAASLISRCVGTCVLNLHSPGWPCCAVHAGCAVLCRSVLCCAVLCRSVLCCAVG